MIPPVVLVVCVISVVTKSSGIIRNHQKIAIWCGAVPDKCAANLSHNLEVALVPVMTTRMQLQMGHLRGVNHKSGEGLLVIPVFMHSVVVYERRLPAHVWLCGGVYV